MKYNSYIYPYVSFKKAASPAKVLATFSQITVDVKIVKNYLQKLPQPNIKLSGITLADKILNLFLHPEVRFGPQRFILAAKRKFLEQINYFIAKHKPVEFVLLSFPFKIPVPLKTNRHLPDMGELLALRRLDFLMRQIKKIYRPGAILHLFTEGSFAPFAQVSIKEAREYHRILIDLARIFKFDKYLNIVSLKELEKLMNGFWVQQRKLAQNYSQLYKAKDRDFVAKFNAAFPSVFCIVNARHYNPVELYAAYQEYIPSKKLSPAAKYIRSSLESRARNAVFSYLAYLEIRNQFRLLEQYSPQALKLTVSPKPARLGIIPVDKNIIRLPTHGVTVFDAKNKYFTIEYLFDIEHSKTHYDKVYFNKDKEQKPFFYIRR